MTAARDPVQPAPRVSDETLEKARLASWATHQAFPALSHRKEMVDICDDLIDARARITALEAVLALLDAFDARGRDLGQAKARADEAGRLIDEKDAEIARLKEGLETTRRERNAAQFSEDTLAKSVLEGIAKFEARVAAAETARDAALERVRALCEAIEPFAHEEGTWAISVADNYHPGILEPNQRTAHAKAAFSIGDLRQAARALADVKEAL